MINKNLSLHNSFKSILSLALAFPVYIIFFIGKDPIIQGLAYLIYTFPLILFFSQKRIIEVSRLSIIFLVVFLLLWCLPSVINFFDNNLYSDYIRLPILFFHGFIFSILFITFTNYINKTNDERLEKLLSYLFYLLLPIAILIFLQTFYDIFVLGVTRPSPFGIDPTVASELILTILFLSSFLNKIHIKAVFYCISILFFYLIHSRAGLIGAYLFFLIFYFLPILFKLFNLRRFFSTLFLFFILCFFFSDIIFNNLFKFLLLDSDTDGIAGRLEMWLIGLDTIKNSPFLGIGFWVNPLISNLPSDFSIFTTTIHPNQEIHNAFIRIAAENGLLILLLIIFLLIFSLIRYVNKKDYRLIAVILAIVFHSFFSTRHLTLNIMNVVLYLAVINAFVNPKIFKKNIKH